MGESFSRVGGVCLMEEPGGLWGGKGVSVGCKWVGIRCCVIIYVCASILAILVSEPQSEKHKYHYQHLLNCVHIIC